MKKILFILILLATISCIAQPNPRRLPYSIDVQGTVEAEQFIGDGSLLTGVSGSGDMTKAVYDPLNIVQQIVGTTATQTLTNKTLTSPVINNPTGIDADDISQTSTTNKFATTALINTWNAKQEPITLTTTGTSGLATFIGNILNIPNYSSVLDTHIANISNPHSVTKAQVGLSNADNTSDVNKPVSTAQQTALDLKAPLASPTFTGTVIVPSTFTIGANSFTRSGAHNLTLTTTGTTSLTLPTSGTVYSTGTTDVSVADGGTGRSTGTTAYSLIATGTTATGAQQTLANGLTTQILVGGGASALPIWTTATGSGSPVRATSPTLVTPNIGVATATSINGATITSGTLNGTVTGTNTGDQDLSGKQDNIILTTTGTSGAATLIGATLNIPQYTGGGSISDAAYDGTWNGNTTEGASKNAIYDKIESLILGVGTGATPISHTFAGSETNYDFGTTITDSHQIAYGTTTSDLVLLQEGVSYTKSGSVVTLVGFTASANDVIVYYPNVAVPTTPTGLSSFSVTFHSHATNNVTLASQPSAIRWFTNANKNSKLIDLSGVTKIRLITRVITASASVNDPRIVVLYKTGAASTTIGDFGNIGTGATEVEASLATVGAGDSGWIDLDASAIADNIWVAIGEVGGNGTLSPVVGSVDIYFKN